MQAPDGFRAGAAITYSNVSVARSKAHRAIEGGLNKPRSLDESFPGEIEHSCQLATRPEKTDRELLSFVHREPIVLLGVEAHIAGRS